MHPRTLPRVRLLLAALALAGASTAQATWSIVAIHPRTGTIGVAAASCSGGVFGIQSVVPGVGAVIVQAESNGDARREGVRMLREHAPLDAIIARLTDPASGFAPSRQQVALLASGPDPMPRTNSGADIPTAIATLRGAHVSVQGNTLASERVVRDAFAQLAPNEWQDDLAMARALMRALDAGARAGGDRRCGRSASNSAFISLHRSGDESDAPWLSLSVARIPVGAASGTDELAKLFGAWLRDGRRRPSTSVFVVPETDAPRATR